MDYNQQEITATIGNGHAASDAIPLLGLRLLGIYMPAAWTAGAVKLAFKVHPGLSGVGADPPAYDDSGWQQVVVLGGTVLVATLHATPTGKFIALNQDTYIAGRYLQIVGVETDGVTPVNQDAARSFRVVVGLTMS